MTPEEKEAAATTERSKKEVEFLHKLATIRAEDLKFADTKVSMILILASAVAGTAVTAYTKFQPKDTTLLLLSGYGLFILGCIAAAFAVVRAIKALRPRLDASAEISESIRWGGHFNGNPVCGPDLMSATSCASFRDGNTFLSELKFLADPISEHLAGHCVRTGANAHVKYRYVHAAATWVGWEVVLFVAAGIICGYHK